MQHDFADGKYTVINDDGKLTALRHGEHWDRDLCGDSLIYWMLVDCDKMKEQRDELLFALKLCLEQLEIVLPSTGLVHSERQAIISAKAAISKANNS